ncbi:MAG: methyltransferase domain-containing protein [Actinomycetales bacterium]
MGPDPNTIKACCAQSYSSDLVAMLLGASYHPGGLSLTRHVLDLLDLDENTTLVDVASGLGTTAFVAAAEYGAHVVGVDASTENVATATAGAAQRGLADRVRFHVGDAEALPLPAACCEAVISECSLCLFPDKAAAVQQVGRILAPGGRVAIADVTAEPARLPSELTGLTAWVACIADARPRGYYQDLLERAGFNVLHLQNHDREVTRMIDQIEARIELLRLTRPLQQEYGWDPSRARPVLDAARDSVRRGDLGYAVLVAQRR